MMLHLFAILLLKLSLLLSVGCITLRKEIRNMTKQEFDDYVDAIWVYKTEGRKDVSNSEIDAHSCSSVSRVSVFKHCGSTVIFSVSLFAGKRLHANL